MQMNDCNELEFDSLEWANKDIFERKQFINNNQLTAMASVGSFKSGNEI